MYYSGFDNTCCHTIKYNFNYTSFRYHMLTYSHVQLSSKIYNIMICNSQLHLQIT